MNPLAPYVQHKPECLHLQGIAGGYDEHELPQCTCGLSQAIEAQEAEGMTDEEIERLSDEIYANWNPELPSGRSPSTGLMYDTATARVVLRYLRDQGRLHKGAADQ